MPADPEHQRQPVLALEALTAGYGGPEVLSGVGLRLEHGELVVVIGPNGAGKSTVLKAIFGLAIRRSGRILFEGHDISEMPAARIVRSGIGYVPQTANVFPTLTVQENLSVGGFVDGGHAADRMEELLGILPMLRENLRQPAGKLSGGQRQMVAFARALMPKPRVLLLDEPSAGLAPQMVDVVFRTIADIRAAGVDILLVEQNALRALQSADRAYVLASGRNVLDGPAATLLADDDVQRLYLGGA